MEIELVYYTCQIVGQGVVVVAMYGLHRTDFDGDGHRIE